MLQRRARRRRGRWRALSDQWDQDLDNPRPVRQLGCSCWFGPPAEGKQQAGITFLLAGHGHTGPHHPSDHHAVLESTEVNQVFFDNVRVPITNRVGEENQGWKVAKYLLEFERGGGSFAARLKGALRQLRSIAQTERSDDGARLWDDPDFRARTAQVEIETQAVEFTERRVVSQLSTGAAAPATPRPRC